MRCAEEPCVNDSGTHPAARHALQAIVPDCGCGPQSTLHVATFQQVAWLRGSRPDSCETVGLQFHTHRKGVARARILSLQTANLSFNSEQVLDVMSELMGQHIGLGKFAGGTETLFQLVVKSEVDVDLLVARAVERPGGRLRLSASRSRRVPKEHEPGMLV